MVIIIRFSFRKYKNINNNKYLAHTFLTMPYKQIKRKKLKIKINLYVIEKH